MNCIVSPQISTTIKLHTLQKKGKSVQVSNCSRNFDTYILKNENNYSQKIWDRNRVICIEALDVGFDKIILWFDSNRKHSFLADEMKVVELIGSIQNYLGICMFLVNKIIVRFNTMILVVVTTPASKVAEFKQSSSAYTIVFSV